jgi:hypothetical protein
MRAYRPTGGMASPADLERLAARRMAIELAARGIPTPTGAPWHAQTVIRAMRRADAALRGTSRPPVPELLSTPLRGGPVESSESG